MFTGLIENIGTLSRMERRSHSAVLRLSTTLDTSTIIIGDSIACDGVCLTATAVRPGEFSADVSHETLERSTLKHLRPGTKLNIERALRVGDRLGGHFVAGHVDTTARLTDRRQTSESIDLTYLCNEPALMRYVVLKGSIAVDGVSLTVNDRHSDGFRATIVPHTSANTTLLEKRVGEQANIEVDLIGKYIESLLGLDNGDHGRDRNSVGPEILARYGFNTTNR